MSDLFGGDVLEKVPEPEDTPLGHLTAAGQEMTLVLRHARRAEQQLVRAGQLAAEQGRLTPQIASLRHEIDALAQLVGEKIIDTIHKSAEVEAGSQG